MKGIWWEVWGVESGEIPPAILLFKFPEESDGEQAAKEAKDELIKDGATDVKIYKVVED